MNAEPVYDFNALCDRPTCRHRAETHEPMREWNGVEYEWGGDWCGTCGCETFIPPGSWMEPRQLGYAYEALRGEGPFPFRKVPSSLAGREGLEPPTT